MVKMTPTPTPIVSYVLSEIPCSAYKVACRVVHDDVWQPELIDARVDGGLDGGRVADVALKGEDSVARRRSDLLRGRLEHGKAPDETSSS